jgi:hypothetical protein
LEVGVGTLSGVYFWSVDPSVHGALGTDKFGIFLPDDATSVFTPTPDSEDRYTLWFGYDDTGATPDDDNHDDLIIRV